MKSSSASATLMISALIAACARVAPEQERGLGETSIAASTLSQAPIAASAALESPKPNKAIGSHCVRSDGWQRPDVPELVAAGGKGPTMVAITPGLIGPDYHDLAPGVRFCLEGPFYPKGYYTTHCKANDDCGPGNACDDVGLCRKTCAADAECTVPQKCGSKTKHCVREDAPSFVSFGGAPGLRESRSVPQLGDRAMTVTVETAQVGVAR